MSSPVRSWIGNWPRSGEVRAGQGRAGQEVGTREVGVRKVQGGHGRAGQGRGGVRSREVRPGGQVRSGWVTGVRKGSSQITLLLPRMMAPPGPNLTPPPFGDWPVPDGVG